MGASCKALIVVEDVGFVKGLAAASIHSIPSLKAFDQSPFFRRLFILPPSEVPFICCAAPSANSSSSPFRYLSNHPLTLFVAPLPNVFNQPTIACCSCNLSSVSRVPTYIDSTYSQRALSCSLVLLFTLSYSNNIEASCKICSLCLLLCIVIKKWFLYKYFNY